MSPCGAQGGRRCCPRCLNQAAWFPGLSAGVQYSRKVDAKHPSPGRPPAATPSAPSIPLLGEWAELRLACCAARRPGLPTERGRTLSLVRSVRMDSRRSASGVTFSTLRTLSAFLVGEQAEKRRCGQDADRMQIESAPPFVRSARQGLRLGRSLRLCNRLVASAVGLRSRGLGATPAGTSSSDPPVLRTDGCHRGSRQSPSAPGCAPSSSDAAGGRPSRTSCR